MIKYSTIKSGWIKQPIKFDKKECAIYVKAFTLWDGCTSVQDLCKIASLLHDRLYAEQGVAWVLFNDGSKKKVTFTRYQADVLYRIMLGNTLRAWLRFIGLRLISSSFWGKHPMTYSSHIFYDQEQIHTCKHGHRMYVETESQSDIGYWSDIEYLKM